MWEYFYYSGYQYNTAFLNRADITDFPQESCVFGSGWSLIGHPINKAVNPSYGWVVDSFYPNQVVAHLNSTTTHAMKFSYAFDNTFCKLYYPFYQ